MSTRAVFTFRDENEEFHIYKHQDGYPRGAGTSILAALPHAWTLPRFEADEFAAAFCAGNKPHPATTIMRDEFVRNRCKNSPEYYLDNPEMDDGYDMARRYTIGGVRLLKTGKWQDVSPGDVVFHYVIIMEDGKMLVEASEVSCDWDSNEWTVDEIFNGYLSDFLEFTENYERLSKVSS